jgi:hypothetical protein
MLLYRWLGASMPSAALTKAPGPLDVEIDQRDWFSDFREENNVVKESPRGETGTIFMVVTHGRRLPIVLPESQVPADLEATPTLERRRRSFMSRVKRAVSPTLTALFIAYVAIVLMTAWIGIRRGDGAAAGSGDTGAAQMSTSDPAGIQGPANRP